MQIQVTAVDTTHWTVSASEESIGSIQRLATGYIAKRTSDNYVIKRFRMIDALKEVFGEESTYDITPTA